MKNILVFTLYHKSQNVFFGTSQMIKVIKMLFLVIAFECLLSSSWKLSHKQTNLKPDNFCFENNTDVCFFLFPIKLWGGHFIRNLLVQLQNNFAEVEILVIKSKQSKKIFFLRFYWCHQFAHVQCEYFRWRQAKCVSGGKGFQSSYMIFILIHNFNILFNLLF